MILRKLTVNKLSPKKSDETRVKNFESLESEEENNLNKTEFNQVNVQKSKRHCGN